MASDTMRAMTTDFDPYSILQVDPAAELDVIRASYETLRSLYANDAEGRLREIEAAYRMLRDPEQRSAYDERRAAAAESAPVVLPTLSELHSVDGGPVSVELPPRGRSPWRIGEMLKALGIVIAVVVVVGTPITLLANEVAGSQEIDEDPVAWAIALLTSVVLELAMIFAAFRFSVQKFKLPVAALGFRRPLRGGSGLLLGVGVCISAMAIVVVYGAILTALDLQPDTELPDTVFDNGLAFAATLIVVTLLAPVGEEIFFRGFVFGGLRGRFGLWPSALASGTLFAVAHIGNAGYLPVLPAIVAIGMLFAWSYDYSGSIRVPMIGHFLYNTAQILISLAAAQA